MAAAGSEISLALTPCRAPSQLARNRVYSAPIVPELVVSLAHLTRVALISASLLALGGCGRRGDLEPPQAAVATPTPENRHNLDLHRASQKITPPKKDFVLDPLLQ
jgi:predicted small lipoprotein YifL